MREALPRFCFPVCHECRRSIRCRGRRCRGSEKACREGGVPECQTSPRRARLNKGTRSACLRRVSQRRQGPAEIELGVLAIVAAHPSKAEGCRFKVPDCHAVAQAAGNSPSASSSSQSCTASDEALRSLGDLFETDIQKFARGVSLLDEVADGLVRLEGHRTLVEARNLLQPCLRSASRRVVRDVVGRAETSAYNASACAVLKCQARGSSRPSSLRRMSISRVTLCSTVGAERRLPVKSKT